MPQLAGVRIEPQIEVEHVETALGLVAAGAGDSIVSRAVLHSGNFSKTLRAFGFAEPLYDTMALVRREGAYLSPATRKFAELARRTLLDKAATLLPQQQNSSRSNDPGPGLEAVCPPGRDALRRPG